MLKFVQSPKRFGLPLLDLGERPRALTYELVEEKWPQIEILLADGELDAALAAMEELAQSMRQATQKDPEPWHNTLLLARKALYDEMVNVAAGKDGVRELSAVLSRCAAWDKELRAYLQGLQTSSSASTKPANL